MTGFDRFVAELQQQINEQEQALYSAKVIEEAHDPRNLGRMPEPDVRGLVHGWCGDTMEVYLRLEGERIKEVTFMTDGCGPALACWSSFVAPVVSSASASTTACTRPRRCASSASKRSAVSR